MLPDLSKLKEAVAWHCWLQLCVLLGFQLPREMTPILFAELIAVFEIGTTVWVGLNSVPLLLGAYIIDRHKYFREPRADHIRS